MLTISISYSCIKNVILRILHIEGCFNSLSPGSGDEKKGTDHLAPSWAIELLAKDVYAEYYGRTKPLSEIDKMALRGMLGSPGDNKQQRELRLLQEQTLISQSNAAFWSAVAVIGAGSVAH